MSIVQKKVMIIGGSQGMGLGAAKCAINAGAEVIIVGREEAKLNKIVKELGDKATSVTSDLTETGSYDALLEKAGRFDHLFISASPGNKAGFQDTYLSFEDSYLYGKLWLTFLFLQKATPYINKGGSITLLSGGMAVRPHPNWPLVGVAFAAIEAMAQSLAVTLAPLRVNVIRPTNIEKDASTFPSDADRKKYEEETSTGTLLKKIGTTNDIGEAAVFLMSNDFMTGHILDIDGGVALNYYGR
jgi:NAD(P)-dependent dehydrogenase (short-subunit alcohol dehydrogenase family)